MKRRVFIAINPPQELKDKVSTFVSKVKGKYPEVSWVNPENFHVTLFFLGSINEEMAARATGIIKLSLKDHKGFAVKFMSPEIFLTHNNQKLIWAKGSNSLSLSSLQGQIADRLSLNGFNTKGNYFIPHATFGRVKKTVKNIDSLMKDISSFMLDEIFVAHVDIMESVMENKSPVYKRLFRIPLENSIIDKDFI